MRGKSVLLFFTVVLFLWSVLMAGVLITGNYDSEPTEPDTRFRHLYVISPLGGKALVHSTIKSPLETRQGNPDYLQWQDDLGKWHRHYLTGGQIPFLTDYPISGLNAFWDMSRPLGFELPRMERKKERGP